MEVAVWDLKSQFGKYKDVPVFDCMIAEFLLSYGKYLPSVDKVLENYRVSTLQELADKQQVLLSESPELYKLFREIEMPLVSVLWHMEQQGVTLDTDRLTKIGEEIESEIVKLEAEIKKDIPYEINLNSPTQIGIFLAEKEGVPLKKTRTGKYATGESELLQFNEQFPLIQKILEYRGLAKLRSTYVDSMVCKVDSKGKVHTTYHQTAVNTGRLASSNPNLQNIPVTSKFGQKIKSCFQASDGYEFVSFDYSQQELRILAHLSGEEKLITAFKENRDIHKITASQIFNVSYENVSQQQRSVGKTINFGIIYGMSSYGLSKSLNIPVEQAQKFIDAFYTNYPNIKKFYDDYFKKAKINGYVTTLLGRRRNVFENPRKRFIDPMMHRVLLNYPIQGSAADLMKKAMIAVHYEIAQKNEYVRLLLQIHDDLVFEIKEDVPSRTEIILDIREKLCSAYPLLVPIEVDIKTGKRWGEMEKLII